MMSIKVTLLAAIATITLAEDQLCQANEKSPVEFVSTRTLYDSVKGNGLGIVKGCRPIALWSLARHGASYPEQNQLLRLTEISEMKNDIINNHLKWGSGELCEEDLEALKNWEFKMDINQADQLIESDTKTISEISKRIYNQYPYLADSIHVRYTSSQKTKDSADAFMAAVGKKATNKEFVDDILLSKEENSDQVNEVSLFNEGEIMAEVYRNVSSRLGFTNIKPSVIEDIYKLCTYDRLVSVNRISPWCGLFTAEELKIMEFKEDLSFYYQSGYENAESGKKGCTLLYDMMYRLTNCRTLSKSTVNFANTEALRNLLVALDLYKGSEPISHDNYATSASRSWKNSIMTPLNGNLVSVLHQCDGGKKQPSEYYVTLFHNENPINLPWCGGVVCNILTFVDHYTKGIKGRCNFSGYF